MANVMYLHTSPVCSMYLVGAAVVLLHRELVKLMSEVVGGAGIHVPGGVDGVGARLSMSSGRSNLAVHIATVVVDTKVILLEAFEATGRLVTRFVTYLAHRTGSSHHRRC
jgi:hypothetical protein